MIDFRYHLVSLVSVFIALAVGILLGAGPLQEPLEEGVSQTLQQQIDSLRQDRQQLREQLDSSQAGVEHRDEVIGEVTPVLVRERLAGRSVVLVVLPDAATDRVDVLRGQLEAAGATVAGRVDVQSGWSDPARTEDRAALADELVAGLPGGSAPADGTGADDVLAGLLARAVVAPSVTSAGTPDPAARAILEGLGDADLVSTDGAVDARASLALVLAPGVGSATVTGTASPSPSPSGSASPAPTDAPWNALLTALDGGSEGSVVLGPGSSATTGGVVADVREDGDLRSRVSTVDTGGTAMGPLTAVFALAEQANGAAGAYGFGTGAAAPLPEQVLTVAAAVTATPSATPSVTATP
jgi:hypothetical protein